MRPASRANKWLDVKRSIVAQDRDTDVLNPATVQRNQVLQQQILIRLLLGVFPKPALLFLAAARPVACMTEPGLCMGLTRSLLVSRETRRDVICSAVCPRQFAGSKGLLDLPALVRLLHPLEQAALR